MARKEMKEIRDLTVEELTARIRESELKLFKNRLALTTGQLEDTALLWRSRKELARMKMLVSQKVASKA